MQPICIEQYELDASLNHFFSLNPTYEWGGNVHGSFQEAIKENRLHVDSVGMVRAIYEMVMGETLDNLPNVHLMASETDYIPSYQALPGDLLFPGGTVGMVISENSQLSCYAGEKGIVIEKWDASRYIGEVHRGFFRVAEN